MPRQPKTDLLAIERSLWPQYPLIAGIDEVGRGAWAGPVVAAAVVFSPEACIDGVDDSKKLTPEKREKLFDVIVAGCLAYGIAAVDAPTIDAINILQATKQAMMAAVEGLGTRPDLLLIDGNAGLAYPLPQQTVIDGDALSHSIAAASILAKVFRDRLMRKLAEEFPLYGFEKHKGYGTKDHQDALRVHGVLPLHRQSYAPIRVLLSL
jgi:ribonuclease HII